MKIINLQADNIKRLVAINITPDENLVQITGKNAQGKTSVLDAIWWALAGTSNIQVCPIRDGEESAKIRVDLGDIVITRRFKRRSTDEEAYTTSIVVEGEDGSKLKSPQTLIDSLVGNLSFDPFAFCRMKSRDQFEEIKGFVGKDSFDQLEDLRAKAYSDRTILNRELSLKKKLLADFQESNLSTNKDEVAVDEIHLVQKMSEGVKHNGIVDASEARRKELAYKIEANEADQLSLKKKIEDLASSKVLLESEARALDLEILVRIDISAIEQDLINAKSINERVEAHVKGKEYLNEVNTLIGESDMLTDTLNDYDEQKKELIKSAKLPVDNMTFGEDELLLNGVPFSQASDAERLRTSISIAIASNPKIRVMRVRDGSLLDEDSMGLLEKVAIDNDFQIWIERVDSSGKVGFVIEEGFVATNTGARVEPVSKEVW
jgi:DNA repair exonuclease SbcCD ATPase subunit